MKEIWFVRHGESLANAGEATNDHETIPLSLRGREQASAVSDNIPEPELIITSPYLRARETAAPTLQKWPAAKREIWDSVREFVYLAPATCVGTTSVQRRPRVVAYWRAMDPGYCDGSGAESYSQLLCRIRETLQRLRERKESFIVVFTHAQFIRNLLLVVAKEGMADREYMRQFRSSQTVKNGQIIKLEFPC